jgi:hypothetical protein
MKKLLLLTLFWNVLTYSQVEVTTKTINVALKVGVDKLYKLDFTPNTVIDIVNPKVAGFTLAPQRKEINIKALAKGRTNLRIRDTEGKSRIVFAITTH